MGGYHKKLLELQRSAMYTAKWKRKKHKQRWRKQLQVQFDARRRKDEIVRDKKLDAAMEEYIDIRWQTLAA